MDRISIMAHGQPFGEPDFLQSVGSMTISFALLEGTLAAVLDEMDGDTPLADIAAMPYSEKVDWFIDLAKFEFKRLGSDKIDGKTLDRIKGDLKSVADLRNSLNHDFWTISDGRLAVKSLKGKGVPESYPTPQKIQRLADRIWDVRSRLAPVINEYIALRYDNAT